MTDFNWMLWIVTPIIIVYYLYRHVWPAVRKFIRLFQGIRINPRSHLTEAEYKKLSVGSLYALQQGAYLNSLTLDIKDSFPPFLPIGGASVMHKMPSRLWNTSEKGIRLLLPPCLSSFSVG